MTLLGHPVPDPGRVETLRTFHLSKMHLIRAMENGKPGQFGEKECALPYKTNKHKNVTV